MVHPFCNWHIHQNFLLLENDTWIYRLCFFTPIFFCFPKYTKSFTFLFWFSTSIDTPVTSILDLLVASIGQSHVRRTAHPEVLWAATNTMFCTKLKDLKITGECPLSLLAPGQVPQEPAEEVAESSESGKATLPICQDVLEKNVQRSSPQRKTSRSRVYLHTLAESICKLIFPEVSALPFEILLILWKW